MDLSAVKLALLVAVALVNGPAKAAHYVPIVLRERAELREVCAEYTSDVAPRTPNRSCVDAAVVRAWILQNGRRESCE